MEVLAANAPVEVICACSFFAGLWLMWNIRPRARQQLLPRQLWHLALADVTFSLYGFLWPWVSPSLPLGSVRHRVASCIRNFALFASMLFELHVAVGAMALFWRLRGLMRFLNRSVPLCWLLALLGGALQIVDYFVRGSLHELEGMLMMVLATAIFLLYLSIAFRVMWYPARQALRAHMMVFLFPITFAVTLGPLALQWMFHFNFSHASAVCANLNGIGNLLMYTLNANFSRAGLLELDRMPSSRAECDEFVQWAGIRALPVGFAADEEVISVPRDQLSALRNSAAEIRDLDVEQMAGHG